MSNEPKLTLAQLAPDDISGGRWAAAEPAKLGPNSLPVPQWSRDLAAMPAEPPLGVRVDAVPDLGFPYEARLAREKAEAEAEAVAAQPIPTLRRL